MGYFVTLLLILSSIFYTYLLNKFFKLKINDTKYPTIEGIRGYLAYFVFLHHICIWYFYLRNGIWEQPQNNLFNHFGKTGVAFFFMITAFLFTNKLLQDKPINWKVFYRKRFLRLFPIYCFSVFLLIFIVLCLSHFTLNISFGRFIDQSLHWLAFTFVGAPNINNVDNTYIIIAGVAWSLTYEILFYASIPFLGLLFKKKTNALTLILCLIVIILFVIITDKIYAILFWNFFYGIIASILHKYYKPKINLKSGIVSIVLVLLIIFNVSYFKSSENFISISIQAIIFIIIIYGNNFWGVLVNKQSQILGQLSYSIYLIHGIVLFVFNTFIFDKSFLITLNFHQYLSLGFLYTFVIVLVSFITHKYIELPFMNTKKIK